MDENTQQTEQPTLFQKLERLKGEVAQLVALRNDAPIGEVTKALHELIDLAKPPTGKD